jgi:hypothetical protein
VGQTDPPTADQTTVELISIASAALQLLHGHYARRIERAESASRVPTKHHQPEANRFAMMVSLAQFWLEQGWPLNRTHSGAFVQVGMHLLHEIGTPLAGDFQPLFLRRVIAEAKRRQDDAKALLTLLKGDGS